MMKEAKDMKAAPLTFTLKRIIILCYSAYLMNLWQMKKKLNQFESSKQIIFKEYQVKYLIVYCLNKTYL